MKKYTSIVSCSAVLIALMLGAQGCSSSQTSDSEFGDDVPADAGTDAVPSASAENNAQTDSAQAQASPEQQPEQQPQQDQQMQTASTDPQQQQQPVAEQPQASPADTNSLAATQPVTQAPEAQPEPQTAAPVVASTESSSTSSGSETYHVRRGDTLMRIAFEKYGDLYKWKQIYESNRDKIKNPNMIIPGTVLTLDNTNGNLPARTGHRYTIKRGDTLASISNDVYGTPRKWKKIWNHNKPWIPNPNKIFAGFYVYYTGGKSPEEIEHHEQQDNSPAPVAQESTEVAPREPASAVAQPEVPAQVAPAQVAPVQQAAPGMVQAVPGAQVAPGTPGAPGATN